MNFLEIIRHQLTNLPIQYAGSFRGLLKEKINHFGEIIDSSTDLSEGVGGIPFTPSVFKRRNKILRVGILKTVDAYYEGEPSKAYEILKKALRESNITGYLDKENELSIGSNLQLSPNQRRTFPYPISI